MKTEDLRLKYLINELKRLKLIKNAEDLAKLVSVNKRTAARWMTGRQMPNKKNMNTLNTVVTMNQFNESKPEVKVTVEEVKEVIKKDNIFKRIINWVIKLFK